MLCQAGRKLTVKRIKALNARNIANMKHKIFRYGLVCLVFLVLITESQSFADFNSASEQLIGLFPPAPATLTRDAIKLYDTKTIYDFIDGAADIYLNYGCIACAEGKYLAANTSDYISLEIYALKDAVNAFGIFSNEYYPPLSLVTLGDIGYRQQNNLLFFRGNYYVKIYYNQENLAAMAYDLGAAVNAKLTEDASWKEYLKCFPKNYRVPFSEKYLAKNFLGLANFHEVWTANYAMPTASCTLFYSRATNSALARNTISLLLQEIQDLGGKLEPVKQLGDQAFLCHNEFGKDMLICRKNNFIAGMASEQLPKDFTLVRQLLKQLQ